METPKVLFDFEFHFANGASTFFTAEEGRDRITADDARVRLELRESPGVTEEVIITRSALTYMRTTRREVMLEPAATEGLAALAGAGA